MKLKLDYPEIMVLSEYLKEVSLTMQDEITPENNNTAQDFLELVDLLIKNIDSKIRNGLKKSYTLKILRLQGRIIIHYNNSQQLSIHQFAVLNLLTEKIHKQLV